MTENLEFPCQFPMKVMGRAVPDFEQKVVAIVRLHVPDFSDAAIARRPSRAGRYVSLTLTIDATSREQLDALYVALSGAPEISLVF